MTPPTPPARDAPLLPPPAPWAGYKGVSGCTAPQNRLCQGPGSAWLIPCPPGTPSPASSTRDAQGGGGHGAPEGTREGPPRHPWGASTSCQPGGEGCAQAGGGPGLPPKTTAFVGREGARWPVPSCSGTWCRGGHGGCVCVPPPAPTLLPRGGTGTARGAPRIHPGTAPPPWHPLPHPTVLLPWKGRSGVGTQGVSKLLPPPPPGKGGRQHPWETAPRKHPALRWAPGIPAQLSRQTHHTSGGGQVAPGRGPAPTDGGPHHRVGSVPRSRTVARGRAGAGPDPGASAVVSSACSCSGSARTASAQAQG